MKKIVIVALASIMFMSCSNRENETETQTADTLIEESPFAKSVNNDVSDIFFGHLELTGQELFDFYKNLNNDSNNVIHANNKTLLLITLDNSGFIDNAKLNEIEYLINDQNKLEFNSAAISQNYKLFRKAQELGSNLDLLSLSKDFVDKNKVELSKMDDEISKKQALKLINLSQSFYLESTH